MKRLTAAIEDFLGTTPKARGGAVFGKKPTDANPPSAPDATRLIASLEKQAAFNNRLLITVIVAYLAVLLAAMILVFRNQSDVRWVLGFLGGNFLALLAVGARIHDLWREKNYMDMMLAVLPSLSSAEAVKFIRAFYLEKLAKNARARGASTHTDVTPQTPNP